MTATAVCSMKATQVIASRLGGDGGGVMGDFIVKEQK